MTGRAKTGVDTRRVKYILKFYNSIACRKVERLEEIPIDAANAIMSIRYDVLITPFVLSDMDRGWGRGALALKYGATEDVIRGIGRKNRGKKQYVGDASPAIKPQLFQRRSECYTLAFMASNRSIDSLIIHAEGYHMTQDSAMQAVAQYCNDLELLAAGAKFKDLGISDRRKAMLPEVIKVENGAIIDRYELNYSDGAIPSGSYVKLKLSGTMRQEDGMSSRGIQSIAQDIQRANANPNISGIIIEATTGGGESLSGQTLKNAINDSQKPVLVYAHYLGSAGVHGAIAADYIMAAGNTSSIGSIGTFVSINKEIAKWYNENVDDIYSDASPEKNNEWREYLNGNKEPFVQLVKQDAINFQNEVRKYRNLTGDVEHTLSGAMLPADVALERGLIDGIGTFQDAINMLGQLIESQQQQRNNQHFQQTNEQMFDKLISKLNEQFGWSLGQDASVEDVVSNVQNIETRRAELEATVTEQNEKIEAVTAQATSANTAIEAMNEKIETTLTALSEKNEELATKLEALTAQNTKREEEAEVTAKALANATQNRNSDSAQPGIVDEFKQTFSVSVPVTMYDNKKQFRSISKQKKSYHNGNCKYPAKFQQANKVNVFRNERC